MREINKKKKEQMYGAMLGLEMLQERYEGQKRKLEEMAKQEQHQLKVIEVLRTKRLKYEDEYKHQLRKHYACRVILRFMQLSRDRRNWDNYKLRKNGKIFILEEFHSVKLP